MMFTTISRKYYFAYNAYNIEHLHNIVLRVLKAHIHYTTTCILRSFNKSRILRQKRIVQFKLLKVKWE